MLYKFCDNDNFADLASGRVIYSKSGIPNFPVRLAQEIFKRCLDYLGNPDDICVYDPCCGGGYLLTILGFLNISSIRSLVGSDIDADTLGLARSNLSLLTCEGLSKRVAQLEDYRQRFGKPSHDEALESARHLAEIVNSRTEKPDLTIFEADILAHDAVISKKFKADIVIADVPYGNLVSWKGSNNNVDIIAQLLENMEPILKRDSIVAICSNKKQKFKSDLFTRLERQTIGKRKFEILAYKKSG